MRVSMENTQYIVKIIITINFKNKNVFSSEGFVLQLQKTVMNVNIFANRQHKIIRNKNLDRTQKKYKRFQKDKRIARGFAMVHRGGKDIRLGVRRERTQSLPHGFWGDKPRKI